MPTHVMAGAQRLSKQHLAKNSLSRLDLVIENGVITHCLSRAKNNTVKWKEILGDKTEIDISKLELNRKDRDAFRKWLKVRGFTNVGKSTYGKPI